MRKEIPPISVSAAPTTEAASIPPLRNRPIWHPGVIAKTANPHGTPGITSRRPPGPPFESHRARFFSARVRTHICTRAHVARLVFGDSFPLGKLESFDARRRQCDFAGTRGNVSRSLTPIASLASPKIGRKNTGS